MATARVPKKKLSIASQEDPLGGEGHRILPGGTALEIWTGGALRSLRKQLGATQGELSQILEVAPSSVHRWEAERVTPDRRTCEKLSSLRDISRLLDQHFRAEGRVRFFVTPQARLDGDRPMDLLGLPSAMKRIGELIKAILAGDFS
jgi:DNA-binding XRE family transcriptional regulator